MQSHLASLRSTTLGVNRMLVAWTRHLWDSGGAVDLSLDTPLYNMVSGRDIDHHCYRIVCCAQPCLSLLTDVYVPLFVTLSFIFML